MRRSHARAASLLVSAVLAMPALAACGGDDETPSGGRSTLQQALAAQVAGRIDDAKEGFNDVLAKEPRNKFALYNLGLIAQNEGDFGEAEAKYRAALAVDEAYTPALYNLAIIRTNSGGDAGKKEAVELYRDVIAATPDDANAHLNIAFLFQEMGNQAAADREFKIAVRLNPETAQRIPSDFSSVGTAPASEAGGKSAPAATKAPAPAPSP